MSPLLLSLLLAGCTAEAPPSAPSAETGGQDSAPPGDSAPPEDTGPEEETVPPELYCPADMAAVPDDLGEPVYCIDLYEATLDDGDLGERDQGVDYPDGSTEATVQSVGGVTPSTIISWYQAVAVCLNSGKYLCSSAEWEDGCDGQIGAGGAHFPWGSTWSDDICATVTDEGKQQYDGLQATGSFADCMSPVGAYDMVGNAWEWADPMTTGEDGRPVTDKRGGAYYAGQGSSQCDSPFDEHLPDFTGTIAVRCCMTPLVQ